MKKILISIFACSVVYYSAIAATVSESTAQKVASNFFSSVTKAPAGQVKLFYTETDSVNDPLYYVFNVNTKSGFVIVSADDALYPIIGYSTEPRPYVIPVKGTNVYFWMQERKTEIITNLAKKVQATSDISNQWASYLNNMVPQNSHNTKKALSSMFPSSTAYLVQSTWDQESPYWDDCPGTSTSKAVTGCVATAMCQIMRYWQYPSVGQSSSSYCDCTANGYSDQYGALSANYNHGYGWSAMPLTYPTVADTNLARAMSDAGISVDMDYDPTGSGAFVTKQEAFGGPCAQVSYVQYFKYSSGILDGEKVFSNMTAWQDTLEHELDRSRPIQYAGSDPTEGGHTWVCDGYDASNNFHMNWGWSGANDGWYALNNLNPNTLDFNQKLEALIGIMPPPATSAPVAAFTASAKNTCTGNQVQFIDISSNQPTAWKWVFAGATPDTSSSQNPTVTYSATGTYPVKLIASNSFGVDSVISTTYITVVAMPPAPTLTQNADTLTCLPAGYTYAWYKSGVLVPGQTSNTLVISAKGVYTVYLSNSIGCTMNSHIVVSTVVSGINEISLNDNINAYPNPTTGKLQVQLDMPGEADYRISLTDVLGQTVYNGKLHVNGSDVQTIDLSGYNKGIYFLAIEGPNSRGVKKIILY